ncbi:hypothetical protein IW147_004876 [Coemansia sp. RSA 720]|nr:hypothetical protein IW147_004876 [Coemansia sp. RSA 720]
MLAQYGTSRVRAVANISSNDIDDATTDIRPLHESQDRAGSDLVAFWVSELPRVTAQFCCEHKCFEPGSRQLPVVKERAAELVDNAQIRDEKTKVTAALRGDEACHLLLHLLDVALANHLIDYRAVLSSIQDTAAVLFYSFKSPTSDGLWQAVISLVGRIAARYGLESDCIVAVVDLAQIALEQLHMVSLATQTATIGLVYVLRTRLSCEMDPIVESAVSKCKPGNAQLKHNMGQVILAIYDKDEPLPTAVAESARVLAGDWDSRVRLLWQQIAAKSVRQPPLVPTLPFAALKYNLGDRFGLPQVDYCAVSCCAGALSMADAMLVVKLVVESASNSGFGLSDTTISTIGSLYRATAKVDTELIGVYCACAVVIAGAARRICADELLDSVRRPLLARLVTAVKAQTPFSHHSNVSTEDTDGGMYWILELLFQLCVSDNGAISALLFENAEVRLLLLDAAAACSNIAFAVYVCQVAPGTVVRSNDGPIAWSAVEHMLGAAASDAVCETARRCARSAKQACEALSAMSLDTTSVKDASNRLGKFDESLFEPLAKLDELRIDRSLLCSINTDQQPFLQLEGLVRRPCVVSADLFLQHIDVFCMDGLVTSTPLAGRGALALRITTDSVSWAELIDEQRISGIDICLTHGFVQPVSAFLALQDIAIDQLNRHNMQRWHELYSAAAVAAAYDTGSVDTLRIERHISRYDMTTESSDIDYCFAIPPGCTIDATVVHKHLNNRSSSLGFKAKEAFLYYATSQDRGYSDCINELYTQVLSESTSAIRFTASGTFDAASRLITDMSTSPTHAPRLLTDHLSTAAVEQLAAFIPQLIGMLSFQHHGSPDEAEWLASDSAQSLLELLIHSAPDSVVFYAVVASNSLPLSSSGGARIARLLKLFDSEQVASIRAFIACVNSVAVLPQEQLRWACIKAKSVLAKAVAVIQKSKQLNVSRIVASLQPAYQVLDEYTNLEHLPTPIEKEFINLIPRLRQLLDQLQCADDFCITDAQQQRWRLDGVWADVFKALGTPATLPLTYISPKLARFASAVPIPMLTHPAEPMYFDRVGDMLRVIGSKTRPKLLTMHFHTRAGASVSEQYIFKGSEDLRIDESVMQAFIRLNRVMGTRQLHAGPDQQFVQSELAVYNVVPTAAYGGMIQVVDHAPSLFTLYSQHCAQRTPGDTAEPIQGRQPVGLQQIFADHAKQALAKAELSPTLPPSKWPQAVAEKVYNSLRNTVPSNLLHMRLMRSAASSAHLLVKTQRLVQSIGMASAAGYVLGLGDRHLDNLLVDLNSAQLVHIDFNVCYDFGGVSQIPEQVPYRMTPVLAYMCGSAHDSLAKTPFAMSRGFVRAFASTLQFARMDRDVLANAVVGRSRFRPFMEWCWIEEQRVCEPPSNDPMLTVSLPLPSSLSDISTLEDDPMSVSTQEYIERTGLCPPHAFWPPQDVPKNMSLTEVPFGWRIARGAVDRVHARLQFGALSGASQSECVRQQTVALWEAATSTSRLSRMFAGWASWI